MTDAEEIAILKDQIEVLSTENEELKQKLLKSKIDYEMKSDELETLKQQYHSLSENTAQEFRLMNEKIKAMASQLTL